MGDSNCIAIVSYMHLCIRYMHLARYMQHVLKSYLIGIIFEGCYGACTFAAWRSSQSWRASALHVSGIPDVRVTMDCQEVLEQLFRTWSRGIISLFDLFCCPCRMIGKK